MWREPAIRHVVEVKRVFVFLLEDLVVDSLEGSLVIAHWEVIKATEENVELNAVDYLRIVEVFDEVANDCVDGGRDLEVSDGVQLQLAQILYMEGFTSSR